MDYNKIYEELQLADNYNAILKLDLYCQIRKYVQDTEFDSSFIDKSFCWAETKEGHFFWSSLNVEYCKYYSENI